MSNLSFGTMGHMKTDRFVAETRMVRLTCPSPLGMGKLPAEVMVKLNGVLEAMETSKKPFSLSVPHLRPGPPRPPSPMRVDLTQSPLRSSQPSVTMLVGKFQ